MPVNCVITLYANCCCTTSSLDSPIKEFSTQNAFVSAVLNAIQSKYLQIVQRHPYQFNEPKRKTEAEGLQTAPVLPMCKYLLG